MNDLRWQQRLQNFNKAIKRLYEGVDRVSQTPNDLLLQAGLIQSFEFTFELGWKLLKDYLYSQGFTDKTPKEVIRRAFAVQIIQEGEIWLEMLQERNETSHIYDETISKRISKNIIEKYYQVLKHSQTFFIGKVK